jgi:hypothetical protein
MNWKQMATSKTIPFLKQIKFVLFLHLLIYMRNNYFSFVLYFDQFILQSLIFNNI